MTSGRIYDADRVAERVEKEGILSIPKNEVELQNAFDMFVRNHLNPFAPELRSIKRINDSIYTVFGARRNEDSWAKIQAMVLAPENQQLIINVINLAKEMYLEHVGKGKHEVVQNDEPWNVPKFINYNLSYTKKDYSKSIIQPYYAHIRNGSSDMFEDSEIEVNFINYLEKAKTVVWWFKNGSQDGSYFAVPYLEHGQKKSFYVDFIVLARDGQIGLFDTKGGLTAETATARAEGLAEYIFSQKDKRLFGGIVLNENNSWRYNDKKKYSYNPNDLAEWNFLNL